MYSLLRRLRDVFDAVVHRPADPVTDEAGVIDVDRLSVRQLLVMVLRMGPRILTRMAAFDEGQKLLIDKVDELNYNVATVEVIMSDINDALAEQGAAIGRLAAAVDDELEGLQAQLAEAQDKLDNDEAADLAEAMAVVEGIRANTSQLTAMADQLQANDTPAEEPAVEPEQPAEPTEEPAPDPGTEVEEPVQPTDPETEPDPEPETPAQSR